jgi:hypothetical protein
MKPHVKKPTHRELSPEDMTMHDIVAMFFATGLLSAGQYKNANQVIEQSMVLADLFLEIRKKENNHETQS